MKLLAIGTNRKTLKSWSVPIETDKPEELNLESVSAELYKDEKSEHEIPSSIALIKVEDGLPILHGAYRFVDDDWENVEPEVEEVVAEVAETPKV